MADFLGERRPRLERKREALEGELRAAYRRLAGAAQAVLGAERHASSQRRTFEAVRRRVAEASSGADRRRAAELVEQLRSRLSIERLSLERHEKRLAALRIDAGQREREVRCQRSRLERIDSELAVRELAQERITAAREDEEIMELGAVQLYRGSLAAGEAVCSEGRALPTVSGGRLIGGQSGGAESTPMSAGVGAGGLSLTRSPAARTTFLAAADKQQAAVSDLQFSAGGEVAFALKTEAGTTVQVALNCRSGGRLDVVLGCCDADERRSLVRVRSRLRRKLLERGYVLPEVRVERRGEGG